MSSSLEYLPKDCWGLDPVHCAYAKLYIKDILEIEPYPGGEDAAYAYKNHPIYRVDIMGRVVRVDERQAFFQYGVDDGTGVINCSCWKPKTRDMDQDLSQATDNCNSFAGSVRQHLGDFDRQQMTRLELGDIIHVRGRVKLFRGRREISAAYYRKVSGDGCLAEIHRMKELPEIHRRVYDIPYKLPSDVRKQVAREKEEQETGFKTQSQLVNAVCSMVPNILVRNSISNFYLRELETIDELVTCASQPCKEYQHIQQDVPPAQLNVTQSAPVKQLRTIFRQAVERLLQEGVLYRHGGIDNRIEVVQGRNSLSTRIIKILQDDCQLTKYENGCHVLHIRDRLRNMRDFAHITPEAVHLALDWLEEQSDVISTTEKHYIAIT